MKKRIYISLCVSGILVAVLTSVLVMGAVYGGFRKEAMGFLQNQGAIISDHMAYSPKNQIDYLAGLKDDLHNLRLTLIEPDGKVLYDSFMNAGAMENHANRAEVKKARESGQGKAIRYSGTLGAETYYYAKLLPNGSILRLSQESKSVFAVFYNLLPVIGAIILLILGLCLLVASWLTKRLLKPIYNLTGNIAASHDFNGISSAYDELIPLFNKIKEQNLEINEQITKLEKERDTINVVTGNMKEGLVILDKDLNILSVNESAMVLLGAPLSDYLGKSLLALSRNLEIVKAVKKALAGDKTDMTLALANQYRRLFIYGVTGEKAREGAMILILDVTGQVKSEKMRQEFSANVSHELKTPLTSISGYAEMITNGMAASAADVQAFAARIQKEAGRLITLIDDIINLSMIEEGGAKAWETVRLQPLCDEVREILEVQAQFKEVSLETKSENVAISGNRAMLRELLFNLCDNAVKYNKPGGRVSLTVRKEGARAIITVADTGIGIPRDQQDRIFERFYRVDKSRSKATGGTGLGLSIVKHVVENHKGSINLQSEAGKGTTITVQLPVR